jgi:hypothetical protein
MLSPFQSPAARRAAEGHLAEQLVGLNSEPLDSLGGRPESARWAAAGSAQCPGPADRCNPSRETPHLIQVCRLVPKEQKTCPYKLAKIAAHLQQLQALRSCPYREMSKHGLLLFVPTMLFEKTYFSAITPASHKSVWRPNVMIASQPFPVRGRSEIRCGLRVRAAGKACVRIRSA